ncbi:MAG: hypothetical protein ACPGYX_03165 [Oceanobacter sp.]
MIIRSCGENIELYCLTENPSGLDSRINPIPLLDNSLTGWWQKLTLFQPDVHGLSGDFLYVDLDVVIVADLAPLFNVAPGKFVIGQDLQTGEFNSSVFRIRIGQHPEVWSSFQQDRANIIASMHGDQDWISRSLQGAELWPDGWVVSFKKQCSARVSRSWGVLGRTLRKSGLMQPKGEAIIPDGARVVQFHGKPDPEDVMNGPYGLYRAAPWIKRYWY